MAEQYSWLDASGKGYSAGQYSGEAGKLRKWSRGTVADGKWLNRETIEPFSGRDQYLLVSLNQTYDECSAFSGDLQNQINVIEARADVVDVVGSYGDFVNKYSAGYVPGIVSDNDVVKILNDETSAHSQTYYRWHSADNPATGTWIGVGSLDPSYNNANISDGILTVNNTNTERNYTLSGEKYIELNGNGKTGAFGLTDEFISSASQCYTALTSHSAGWDETSAMLNENSGYWDQAYTALTSNSASWNETSATLHDNSGKWEQAYDWSKDSSANLISVSSTFVAYSGKWNDASATLFNNSGKWEQAYTALTSTSAGWDKTSAWVYNNSANIVDASATLYNNSANWQATYSAVSSNSAIWNETAYVPLSAQECLIGSGNTVISRSQNNNIVFIQGRDNSAHNWHSFAQGQDNIVENTNSFAQGYANHTYGQGAFAQGMQNSARGSYSIAMGLNNIAFSEGAIALGANNYAHYYSLAAGGSTDSRVQGSSALIYSLAVGFENKAEDESIAVGIVNNASGHSIAVGTYTDANNESFALGWYASATDNSLVLGSGNTASYQSVAIGKQNSAYMDSIAIGSGNTAKNYSQAFGDKTSAFDYSMAIGKENYVSGNGSIAGGVSSNIIGNGTLVIGEKNAISADASIVAGKNNTINEKDKTASYFVLGNDNIAVPLTEHYYWYSNRASIIAGYNNKLSGTNAVLLFGRNHTVSSDVDSHGGAYIRDSLIVGEQHTLKGELENVTVLGKRNAFNATGAANFDYVRDALIAGFDNTVNGSYKGSMVLGGENRVDVKNDLNGHTYGNVILGEQNRFTLSSTTNGLLGAIIAGLGNNVTGSTVSVIGQSNNAYAAYSNIFGYGNKVINSNGYVYDVAVGNSNVISGNMNYQNSFAFGSDNRIYDIKDSMVVGYELSGEASALKLGYADKYVIIPKNGDVSGIDFVEKTNGNRLSQMMSKSTTFTATGSNFNQTFNYTGFKLSAGDGVGFVKNGNTLAISAQAGIPEGTFRINATINGYGNTATSDIDHMEINRIRAFGSVTADDCNLYVSGVDNGNPVTAKYSMWEFYENSAAIATADITKADIYVPTLSFGYGGGTFAGLRQYYFKLNNLKTGNYVSAAANQSITFQSAATIPSTLTNGVYYII